ncbi:MAG: hypothetical protein JOZ18_07205, partial [Chloroflexi bacterium]|nr:hypothetical protein [Chloroflexota bacterium]
LRIEQPELYYAVHRFLAQTNKQWAIDVSGADQVHYLGEYLYHSIYSEGSGIYATIMNEIAETFPESFAQFSDEVAHDEELQELMEGR